MTQETAARLLKEAAQKQVSFKLYMMAWRTGQVT